MIKIILIIIIMLVALWNGTIEYIDKHIDEKYDKTVYNSKDKIWIARGLYNNRDEEDSVTSTKRAFDKGATGVEIDFYYDTKMDKFIVDHDKPKKDKDGNLIYLKKDGKLLTLEELFLKTGKGHYFYLDYKNLDRITFDQTKKAIERLEKITKFDNIKQRVYIEGSNPFKVEQYTNAGFKTLLGIHPLPESNPFSSIVINGYKIAYYFRNITALAMGYGTKENPIYGEKTEKLLKGIPLFLFHTPMDEKFLRKLVEKKDVKQILPGSGVSIDRTYIRQK